MQIIKNRTEREFVHTQTKKKAEAVNQPNMLITFDCRVHQTFLCLLWILKQIYLYEHRLWGFGDDGESFITQREVSVISPQMRRQQAPGD